jgi:hypothetical protein
VNSAPPAPLADWQVIVFVLTLLAWPVCGVMFFARQRRFGSGFLFSLLVGGLGGSLICAQGLVLLVLGDVDTLGEISTIIILSCAILGPAWLLARAPKDFDPSSQQARNSWFPRMVEISRQRWTSDKEKLRGEWANIKAQWEADQAKRRKKQDEKTRIVRKASWFARQEEEECAEKKAPMIEFRGIWKNHRDVPLRETTKPILKDAAKQKQEEQSAPPVQRSFATIEFEYVDRAGNRTRRRVDVWAVDDEYLEGWCHHAQDARTFVVGRIRGWITDTGTGEILPSREWARAAQNNPANGKVDYNAIFERAPRSHIKARPSKVQKPEIHFTGFPTAKKKRLQALATERGMQVRETVTQGLDYLCTGPNAGPTKVAKAKAQGIILLNEQQLGRLWETGELSI